MSVVVLLESAAGQQMAVGLGSPNTRDSMSYADAKISLGSFEETNFVAVWLIASSARWSSGGAAKWSEMVLIGLTKAVMVQSLC